MTPETPKESPNATIQGQAQQKIQDEDCFILEGQLLMLELLTDVTLAQTFLIIKKDQLRLLWIRQNIVDYLTSKGMEETELDSF